MMRRHLVVGLAVGMIACGGGKSAVEKPIEKDDSPVVDDSKDEAVEAPSCAEDAELLVNFRAFAPGGAMALIAETRIHVSGYWSSSYPQTGEKSGCLSGEDLAAVNATVSGADPKVVSSNQSCPKAAVTSFELTLGKAKPVEWDDGGCGTELDDASTAIMKRINELN